MSSEYDRLSDRQFSESLEALLQNEMLPPPPAVPLSHFSSTMSQQEMNQMYAIGSSTALLNEESSMSASGMGNLFGHHVALPAQTAGADNVRMPPPTLSRGTKRHRQNMEQISEDESDRERRRQDRNLREQQRSNQISKQIEYLKEILDTAGIESKNDKYSTLVAVVDYVKALQEKSSMLDAEHEKLLQTITQTSEWINNPQHAITTDGEGSVILNDVLGASCARKESAALNDESVMFGHGIDYTAVFKCAPFPFAVANMDGRFLECNHAFQRLTGFSRDQLLPLQKENRNLETAQVDVEGNSVKANLSLFNILGKVDMDRVFQAMKDMLQQNHGGKDTTKSEGDCWSSIVTLSRGKKSQVNRIYDYGTGVRGKNCSHQGLICSNY